MKEILKRFVNDPNKKILVNNTVALTILQIGNYILPLITLPYLLRVLGPGKYGLIIFSQALVQYFIIVTQYGFNLTATREIAINKNNKSRVSLIFNAVMIIKLLLTLLCFLLLIILIVFIDRFSADYFIYLLTFGMVIGDVLFPIWYFQGIQKMKYITVLNLFAKIVFTLLIFICVRDSSDFIWVPVVNSFGMISSGVLSIIIVNKFFDVRFFLPDAKDLIHFFKDGWYVFLSTFSISLYTVTNTFVLGLFTSNSVVGYFGAAQKIIEAAEKLFMPIQQAIFPFISRMVQENKGRALKFIKKATVLMSASGFIVFILILISAPLIIRIISGTDYGPSVELLMILSPLPMIIAITNMLGTQTLLTFNFKRIFSLSIIIPSILHVALILWIVPTYGATGLAIMTVLTEIFIVLYRAVGIYKNRHRFREGREIE